MKFQKQSLDVNRWNLKKLVLDVNLGFKPLLKPEKSATLSFALIKYLEAVLNSSSVSESV